MLLVQRSRAAGDGIGFCDRQAVFSGVARIFQQGGGGGTKRDIEATKRGGLSEGVGEGSLGPSYSGEIFENSSVMAFLAHRPIMHVIIMGRLCV